MPVCPICGEEFGASGIHPHLRSHETGELVSVVAQVAKNSEQLTNDEPTTSESVCHQKDHRMEIVHQRNERNRKIKQHLRQLDKRINATLQKQRNRREKN